MCLLTFNLHFKYFNDSFKRPIVVGASKDDLCSILNRHLPLADVEFFEISANEKYVPFKEYTI